MTSMTPTPPADQYQALKEAAEIAERNGDRFSWVQTAPFLALLAERERLENSLAGCRAGAEAVARANAELSAALRKSEERAVTQAARDVLAERQRQVSAEGWSREHDDEHSRGELAQAAACYATSSVPYEVDGEPLPSWPWEKSWWKPTTPRRDLVKAGALILAEIERIDRATLTNEATDV